MIAKTSISSSIILALATVVIMHGTSSVTIAQQTAGAHIESSTVKILPIERLYGHFLLYQGTLDAKAEELSSKGKDGKALRNDLQRRLGFTDTEYAIIRTSSQRITQVIKPYDDQIWLMRSSSTPSSATISQINMLSTKRKIAIYEEVQRLISSLSPDQKSRLDAFITAFYAPKSLSVQIPLNASSTGQAVQK